MAKIPGVTLRVVVPNRWRHYGQWRGADPAISDSYSLDVEKVAIPWAGPAQCYLHWYPRLRRILAEFQPDVIDLWEEPWGLVSAHACWLRNRILPQARIICETEQNIDKKLPFPFETFRRYVLRNSDFAVGRSAEAVSVLRSKGFTGHVQVVPNGVDTTLFRPLDGNVCRKELGLSGFIVGYLGRLVEEKGLIDLLHALPECHSSVRLLLIGSGPAEGKLRLTVKELEVDSRVQILPSQATKQLPRLINAFHCLVLPSQTTRRWKEQFGRVLIEAGACGVPVIGSDSGAIPDVLGDGGLIVPERNPAALAAAIERLRCDPALRRELGTRGGARAESQFSWERIAEQFHQIYKHVVGLRRVKRCQEAPASLIGLEGECT